MAFGIWFAAIQFPAAVLFKFSARYLNSINNYRNMLHGTAGPLQMLTPSVWIILANCEPESLFKCQKLLSLQVYEPLEKA